MYRDISEFEKRRDMMRLKQDKKSTSLQFSGRRGIEAFFSHTQSYYQESEQNDEEDKQDTSPETKHNDLDKDVDKLDKDLEQATENDDEESSEEEDDKLLPKPEQQDGDTDVEDPIDTFGQHGGDDLPNNQYDPAEVSKIMEFVADEAKALSDYMEAAKTSKLDILQRLYTDIGDEERYHMEQLLFVKAEITGETYQPHDPDIRKEYEELLAMGMDESSAMSTAVDKFNLRVTSVSSNMTDDTKEDMEELNDAIQEADQLILYIDTLSLVMEYADDTLLDKIVQLPSSTVFQEDVSVSSDNTYSKKLNGFSIIFGLIININKLFRNIAKLIRRIIEKLMHRNYQLLNYVKKHGVTALFKHGVRLYLWNDKTSTMDIDPLLFYANNCVWLTHEVIKLTRTGNLQYGSQLANLRQLFVVNGNNQKFKTQPPAATCYRNIISLDPVKTKVIVTNENAKGIDQIFFSSLQEDDQYTTNFRGKGFTGINPNGINVSPPLQNFFNILDCMIQAITYVTNLVTYYVGELEGLQSDNNSVYYKNPKVYNICSDYMKGVTKGLQTLYKICASDLGEMQHLQQTIVDTP